MVVSVLGTAPMDFVQIEVTRREKIGSGVAARLRREGRVPVVLYGLKKETLPLVVTDNDLQRFLRTGNRLVELKLDGNTRTAILREVQYDPISDHILHVDFVRVDKDREIEDSVPVIYKGRAKGAGEGGVFQSLRDHVDVRCRPADLPKEIVLEVDHLGLHEGIHARDIKLPAGVALVTPPAALMCVVTMVKVEVAPAVPAEGAPAEPELIGRKEAAEEGAEAGGDEKKGEKKPGADKAGGDKGGEKKPAEKKPAAEKK
jgi:large subunit ribosomal protein L25